MNKKKLLALLMALVMTLTLVPVTAFAARPTATEGDFYVDDNGVYHIANLAGLMAFRDSVNSGDTYEDMTVRLDNDIDLSSVESWVPIGKAYYHSSKYAATGGYKAGSTPFTGTFDGGNHTISNLKVATAEPDELAGGWAAGLFGIIKGGTVKNFTIHNARVSSETRFAGAVAGGMTGGEINNVKVTGIITISGRHFVGGIAGMSYGTIQNCSVTATGTISADDARDLADKDGDDVGGIVGYINSTGIVRDSSVTSADLTVQGLRQVGGLIGKNDSGKEEGSNSSNAKVIVIVSADAAVAQIGTTNYASLADAIAAAQNGDTVRLLHDVTLSGTLVINNGKTFTLDLGDNTLGGRVNVYNTNLTVRNGTINGGQALNVYGTDDPAYAGTNYTVVTVASDVTLTGGYGICIFGDPDDTYYPLGYGVTVNMYGKSTAGSPVFVSGNIGLDNWADNTGTEYGADSRLPSDCHSPSEAMAKYGPVLNVYDGAVLGAITGLTAENAQGISLNGMATVNVYDGAIISGGEGIGVKSGILNVHGGTITGTGAFKDPIEAVSSGTEASGGAISVSSFYASSTKYGADSAGIQVNISGGTIYGTNNSAVRVGHSYKGGTPVPFAQGVSIQITGGKFDSGYEKAVYMEEAISGDGDPNEYIFSITGGTFNGKPADEYIAANYEAVNGAQADWYQVVPASSAVAKIGEAKYATVESAIDAATEGQTVELLCNASMTGTTELTMDKSINLDLKGHTLSVDRINLKKGGLNVISNPAGGIVSCGSQAFNVYGSETEAANYTTLTIGEGVTVGGDYAVCLFPVNNDCDVSYGATININGTLSGNKGTLFVSGNLGDNPAAGTALANSNYIPVINIGSTAVISSIGDQAIAMNGMAVVNVATGAHITGREAIGVKRGILNVRGGTLTATGDEFNPAEANYNGTEKTGAAISVTSTYNYAGNIQVNVSGGTITSTKNAALYVGHSVDSKNKTAAFQNGVTLNVTGGSFNGGDDVVYVATAIDDDVTMPANFITGGKYSAEPDSSYVATGYEAVGITGESPYTYQVGKVKATELTPKAGATATSATYTAGKTVTSTDGKNTPLNTVNSITVNVTGTNEETVNGTAAATAPASLNNIASVKDLVETVTSKTGNAETVDVTIQLAKGAADTSQNGKIGYEVHPEAIISVNNAEVGKVKLENDQITGGFSFKLYVGDLGGTGRKVKVTHVHDDGTEENLGIKDVDEQGYITLVGIKSFSEFWSEPVTVNTTTGDSNTYFEYVGASLRRRVNTSARTVVLNTSTDIRFQYTLKNYDTYKDNMTYFFQWSKDGSSWKTVPVKQFSAVDSNGNCTASLVINGVPSGAFASPIYTRIYAVDGEGESYMLTPGTNRANTVNDVAEAIILKDKDLPQWIYYAKYLLGTYGVNSYTVTYDGDGKPNSYSIG